ncbi:MAG: cell wall-binding repeat-containing protein, partial [Eubacterium sp.]|nr:cell wall-binding repeat-containing protein [Eubacterium sp.]
SYFTNTVETFAGDMVFFASGANFPDGLAGGPLACTYGAPLLLIDKGRTTDAAGYNALHGITRSVTLGGTGVLPDETVAAAKTYAAADTAGIN